MSQPTSSKKPRPKMYRLKGGAELMVRRRDLLVMVEEHTDAAFLQTFAMIPFGKLAAALRRDNGKWLLVRREAK